ncbi:HPr kinase/phosphorylase [Szabonella alba]|uniref:Serine kinase n=1 Tax=Szabonella alba TaxID=2804194 RepID=A0A8K0Y1Q8_9RHOB|nr:serine kinase [Szabonella alba]MBL4918423.1 serine kinase [Szabonella alba]
MAGPATVTVHGSCISHHGRAALILGASGAGKSGLALQLMALGAGLIADDRVRLSRSGAEVIAACPPRLSGLIEARGFGLLPAAPAGPAPVALIVDLDGREDQRLPPDRKRDLLDVAVDLVFPGQGGHFAAAIMLYLTHGRRAEGMIG